jgi:O-antigen ligase
MLGKTMPRNNMILMYVAFGLWMMLYALGSLDKVLTKSLQGVLFAFFPTSIVLVVLLKSSKRFVTYITRTDLNSVIIIAIAISNFFYLKNRYGEATLVISGFLFLMILMRMERWYHIPLNVMRFYAYIHLCLGYFLWFNPNFIRNGLVHYYALGSHLGKTLRMLEKGYMLGITSHYSTMGMILAVALIIMCTKHIFVVRAKPTPFGYIAIGITYLGLILTGKRAHLLFGTLAVVITYLRFYKRNAVAAIVKWCVIGGIVLLLAYLALRNTAIYGQVMVTLDRFSVSETDDLNDISTGRLEHLWIPGWQLFMQEPLFGIGWGGFNEITGYNTHNVYLQILCDTGILGFSAFMLFFVGTFVTTYKYLKRENEQRNKQYFAFSFCMQLFFLMYCFTGNPLYDTYTFIPYMIACAITHSQKFGESKAQKATLSVHVVGKGRLTI